MTTPTPAVPERDELLREAAHSVIGLVPGAPCADHGPGLQRECSDMRSAAANALDVVERVAVEPLRAEMGRRAAEWARLDAEHSAERDALRAELATVRASLVAAQEAWRAMPGLTSNDVKVSVPRKVCDSFGALLMGDAEQADWASLRYQLYRAEASLSREREAREAAERERDRLRKKLRDGDDYWGRRLMAMEVQLNEAQRPLIEHLQRMAPGPFVIKGDAATGIFQGRAEAAEARLATAEGLLQQALDVFPHEGEGAARAIVGERIRAFLAAPVAIVTR